MQAFKLYVRIYLHCRPWVDLRKECRHDDLLLSKIRSILQEKKKTRLKPFLLSDASHNKKNPGAGPAGHTPLSTLYVFSLTGQLF